MISTQLRLLKWITAFALVGGGASVLMARGHSIPESLLIAGALAVPSWVLLHAKEKGIFPRLGDSRGKTQFKLALFCLLLQPPMIFMGVMSHDYFFVGCSVVGLACSAYLVIQAARTVRESV